MLSSRQFLTRPNPRVDVVGDGTTTLTYALQTDPTPLTASIPDVPQTLGTLKLVITNPLTTPVDVSAIGLTLQMGTDAADFGTTTDGSGYSVSDNVNWAVTPPSEIVTDGPAMWVVGPSGDSVALDAGASIVVELIEIPVNLAVGTTTLTIVEKLADGTGGQTSFDITKFPYGFYFERLIITVPQGSVLVPVAQVANGTPVTLLWNSSVTTPSAFTVLYATNSGQQTGTVTTAGEWTSPTPLASDTVFVVQVKVTGEGGESLTFALATAVSVQNPDVVASTVAVANTLGVTGMANLAGGAAVGATLSAGTANLGALTVNGAASAASLNVSGPATLSGGLNANAVTTGGLAVSNGAAVGSLTVNGNTSMANLNAGTGSFSSVSATAVYTSAQLNSTVSSDGTALWAQTAGGQYTASYMTTGDSNAIFGHNNSGGHHTIYAQNDGGGPTAAAFFGAVGDAEGWGLFTDGRVGSAGGCAHITQVDTRGGPVAATSPLSLGVEVQASGTARLSGGRVFVTFDDAFADLMVPDGGYRVLVTPLARCGGVFVPAKEARGFLVESGDADAEVEVDWLVVADKRGSLQSAERHQMPTEFPRARVNPPRAGGPPAGR